MSMVGMYYSLTKPGMIYGNAVIMSGGFLLASHGQIDLRLFAAALIGMSLVIASGCVFNNYIDRDKDALMERTRDRVSVKGLVSSRHILVFGVILGFLGAVILGLYVNLLVLGIALFGFFAYVFLYTLRAKRRTVHSALVGSLAGATPPVIGYAAVSDQVDLAASLLFLILVLWQMSHFYAIGIRRLDDYTRATLPIMPVVYGVRATKVLMAVYIVLFAIATVMLAALGYAGSLYLAIIGLLSGVWLIFAIYGFWARDDQKWARIMFILSLVIILSFSLLIAIDGQI